MPEPRLAPLPFAPDQYGCRNPRSGADDTISGTHTVHTRRQGNGGRMLPCRPRRKAEYCRHGRDLRCRRTHNDREACLGKPLCPDCYDYRHAVVWNAHAPELWRRTTITLRRLLERATGSRVHLSYAKVAEFQARGVVHFHALIRLDGHDPHDPARLIPPPAGLTAGDLDHAIRQAVTATWFATRTHPAKPAGWDIAWGPQLDIRTIGTGVDGDITDSKVAGYLAKYATKSTEPAGITAIRVTPDNLPYYANPRTHQGRLIRACWQLGGHDQDDAFTALRRWANMLGFRGHFSTKSRRYSVTLGSLRKARAVWRRRRHRDQATDDTTLVPRHGHQLPELRRDRMAHHRRRAARPVGRLPRPRA